MVGRVCTDKPTVCCFFLIAVVGAVAVPFVDVCVWCAVVL